MSGLLGALFYARLLTLCPEPGPNAPRVIAAAGERLMGRLAAFVRGFRDQHRVLAADRSDPGPREWHDTGLVREALLWTLARGIGEDFTPDAARAWNGVVDRFAATGLRDAPLGAGRGAEP